MPVAVGETILRTVGAASCGEACLCTIEYSGLQSIEPIVQATE